MHCIQYYFDLKIRFMAETIAHKKMKLTSRQMSVLHSENPPGLQQKGEEREGRQGVLSKNSCVL